jgi:predicted ester cyclase
MQKQVHTIEENKALIRLLFDEALQRGNLALINEMFSADFIDHSTPDQQAGPNGVKDYFSAIRTGFPDIHVTLEDVIAEGDKVVVYTIWRGIHLGIYEGVLPTGRPVVRTLIQIFRIVHGRIAEEWNEGGGLLDTIEEEVLR